jgi:hypothetical protein
MIKKFQKYNEEVKIMGLEHHFHKHKFHGGDICIYHNPNDKELDGKLCKISYGTRKKGRSFFQGIGDRIDRDRYIEIPFAKSKTNTYAIEFLDVYSGIMHLIYDEEGRCKKDSITRTDTIRTLKGVPEHMLELDPVATRKYKDEQEEERKKIQAHDPYGEEEWGEKDKNKKFKYNYVEGEWAQESVHTDVSGFIDLLDTLQNMSEVIELLKDTKPDTIEKKILSFLKKSDGQIDEATIARIKYIAHVWNDAFEGTSILYGLKRRIDPIIEKLKRIK